MNKLPITIIRIEASNGIGMFTNEKFPSVNRDGFLEGLARRHFDWDTTDFNFPTPSQENLDLQAQGIRWYCAFKTLSQVDELILPEEMEELILAGYTVYLMTVEYYQEGKHQVIYTKDSVIFKKDINSLFCV